MYLLLLTVASTAWIGYRFGGGNHSVQLPILKHYADPSLYTGDLLLTTLDGYTTWFFPLMGRLVRLVGDVELPYFLTWVAGHGASLAALYALSLLAFAHRPSAWLACALFLCNPLSLAGESSLASRLQHGHLATPLLLWAIYFHLRGRLLLAFALCGLTFNLHALYSLYVAGMLATDVALRRRAWPAGRLLAAAASFAVLALPCVVWLLRASEPVPDGSLGLWLQIMRERSALHTFPLSQPASVYGGYLLLLALGLLGWASADAPALRRPAAHFALAVAVLCLAGLVFSEWWPVPLVIKAQLLRSTRWLTYVVLLYVGRLLALSWNAGLLARLGALAGALAFLLQEPSLLAVGLVCLLLEDGRWRQPELALGAVALVVAALTGAVTLPDGLGVPVLTTRLRDALGDARIMACLGAFLLVRAARGRAEKPALAGAAAVACLYALPALYVESRAATRDQSWNEVQTWVRDHTPTAAVILTPPYREGFRQFSERPIVGEWKDGTQQFFDVAFTFEWYRRMTLLGGRARTFDELDAQALLALGREYGAEYVVLPPRARLPFPKLFQNSVAAVYRLVPAPSAVEETRSSP